MRIISENVLHEDTTTCVIMSIRVAENNDTENKVIEIFNKLFSRFVHKYQVIFSTHGYILHFKKERLDKLGIEGMYASTYVEEYLEFIEKSVKIGNYNANKIKEDYERA